MDKALALRAQARPGGAALANKGLILLLMPGRAGGPRARTGFGGVATITGSTLSPAFGIIAISDRGRTGETTLAAFGAGLGGTPAVLNLAGQPGAAFGIAVAVSVRNGRTRALEAAGASTAHAMDTAARAAFAALGALLVSRAVRGLVGYRGLGLPPAGGKHAEPDDTAQLSRHSQAAAGAGRRIAEHQPRK